MLMFLAGIALLVIGYFTYGKFVETVIGPDDRTTPAIASSDGVDFVQLPHWKNMLIQLLNIAGIGPVIGVILGIKFGAITFLIIPVGCVIAGATHDFLSGIMSLRNNGANLPKSVENNLGKGYAAFFSWFMIALLLLVVAVFINVPAKLMDGLILPGSSQFWFWVAVIFIYYIIATMFPVDKIIGAIYPLFGLMLLVGTFAIFAVLLVEAFKNPALLTETDGFLAGKFQENDAPIIPLLFVTIACGIISGFHATQSPIVARTMKTERQAKSTFYGMMIVEGIIAMIWAGAGMAIYNLFPKLMAENPNSVLLEITRHFLGSWMGGVTVVAVVILAITSGDTALRSTRLCLAEGLKIDQKPIRNRFLLCLPLIALVTLLLWWSNMSAKTFGYLWNYFAWGNQILAASTLMAGFVWLGRQKKFTLIALIPGMFMTFIVVTFICWTSVVHKQPPGLGLPINVARTIGLIVAIAFAVFAYLRMKKLRAAEQKLESKD